MARLFTPKIAGYYEDYYMAKGVKFIKGTVLSSFEINSDGKVNSGTRFNDISAEHALRKEECDFTKCLTCHLPIT